MLSGKKIVLGVTGGSAAYKACDLVSRLKKRGAQVRVVLTANACEFVPPLTFETLSGNPAYSDNFDRKFEITPELLDQLDENGQKNGVKSNEALRAEAAPLLKVQMKALIARDLWEMNEYFRIMNEEDASIMKAVELLQAMKKQF